MRQPIPVQQPNANQVSVYCPVCRRGYTNQDAELHAMAHDATRSYNFQTIDRRPNNNTNIKKKNRTDSRFSVNFRIKSSINISSSISPYLTNVILDKLVK